MLWPSLSLPVSAAGAMQIVNTVVLVRSVLNLGEKEVALAFAAAGGGSMLIALLLPKVLERVSERPVMLLGGVMMALQPEERPALFAAQFSLSHSCWLVTYPLAGWLGVNLGLTGTFALLGTVALAATGLAALIWHAHDPMALEHEHAAQSHTHLHYHDEHHQHEHVAIVKRVRTRAWEINVGCELPILLTRVYNMLTFY